jgi:hypothetical protein
MKGGEAAVQEEIVEDLEGAGEVERSAHTAGARETKRSQEGREGGSRAPGYASDPRGRGSLFGLIEAAKTEESVRS